ncbi:flagellar basal-body rod protein FlgC [Lachnospiraceae bacterium PF1-21]|uniref:Flagellar basal-body rod protein FlgC n=1 Tax=Ohessyouella blattaphilus TaxID=2949333 RepID=A0ABT1EF64_9FIRM|nr:flagellar basal body rod protein FlgC [Ohessyouella blattaphilus]MCP1109129.1 flagellar basal body rod protein FlgC [Ohessyouella blattaphilus]MCR8562523.1 flagellar basal body rod protein FlgC [Ohessyouella blattaphilus]MDL2250231.1 flagellar basal body rod protein FlgC [Lachnospiraceae bacterium OttesenSCG-928-J05]
MSFLSSLNISASGMTAQRLRLDVVAENIANIETTRTEAGTAYRRKLVQLEAKSDFRSALQRAATAKQTGGVQVTGIIEDESALKAVYDPSHPDANEEGYLMMPNVDLVQETADAMAATRAYEANITAFNTVRTMAQKALEIGK